MNGAMEGFYIGDSGVYARLFRPHGVSKCPLVVIFHGIPGNEQNSDLAYALRDEGYAVLIPNYNGCWGSNGSYRIQTIPDNVKTVLDYVTEADFIQTWDIDGDRIGVVGHSLGGWAALISPKISKKIKGIIALDPVANLSVPEGPDMEARMASFVIPLKDVTPAQLAEGWKWASHNWQPMDAIKYLDGRYFAVIAASGEDALPLDNAVAIYREGKKYTTHASFWVIDSDHSFVSQRPLLREVVIAYLDEHL
jgi:dienelactone hydrolase